MWGWNGPGWVFMILFWGLIILGIVALVKWLASSDRDERGASRPLDILKERYARGEINREQYEQMRRDLES